MADLCVPKATSLTATTLFFLCISNLASCKEYQILVGVQDTFEGVEVSLSLAPENGSMPRAMPQLTIPNFHLSPECGRDYTRCQDLLVESFNSQDRVIFIPLQGGLALVTVTAVLLDDPLSLHTEYVTLRSTDCSPSAVYKILDLYFAVCTNLSTNSVSVLEIRLDKTSLQDSWFAEASELIVPVQVGNISNASNYLHLEIDKNHEYIIFALGTTFFYLRPLDYSSKILDGDVPTDFCNAVTTLVPLRSATFYAYCTDHLFTYDIGEEDWLVRDTFSNSGIPYQCPGLHTNVSVYENHIHLQFTTATANVDIEGDAYSSGVCFGNATQNYFAFADESAGLSVLNLVSSELLRDISTPGCQGMCYPLVAVNNRYLIVRDARGMMVFDFFGAELELIEAAHVVAPLVTVLAFEQHDEFPQVPVVSGIREDDMGKTGTKQNLGVLIGCVVSAAFILMAVTGLFSAAVCYHKRMIRTPKVTRSIEETCTAHQQNITAGAPEKEPEGDPDPEPEQESRKGSKEPFGAPGYTCTGEQEETQTTRSESDSCSATADDYTPLIPQ